MWEMCSRKLPFEDCKFTKDIEEVVLSGGRPNLDVCTGQWRPLIEKCWHEDPKKRPTAKEVVTALSDMARRQRLSDTFFVRRYALRLGKLRHQVCQLAMFSVIPSFILKMRSFIRIHRIGSSDSWCPVSRADRLRDEAAAAAIAEKARA